MILYIDSSAVMAMLLGEPQAAAVVSALRTASRVVTSALTAVECARSIIHARRLGRITVTEALALQQLLEEAESQWIVHALSDRVLLSARAALPADPVRTLDALHVATALVMRESLGQMTLLSLDARMRACATGLGIPLLPAEPVPRP